MTDRDLLLRAVIDHPDEDTPRLVFADWLEENGDPERAEFIRLHIEWCRRPIDAPPHEDLQQRLTKLWEQGENTWRKMTETVPHVYDRGFIAGVYPRDRFWDAASIFASHPVTVGYRDYLEPRNIDPTFPIDYAVDPDSPYEWEQFLSHPLAERLTALGTDSRHWHDPAFPLLFAHPHASRWRLLHFEEDDTGDAIARAIAGAPKLNNLLVLDLCGMNVHDDAFAAMVSAPHLASLVALRVGTGKDGENSISADGIGALTRTEHFHSLRQLDLADNTDAFEDKALRRLLQWDQIQQIRELNLSNTEVTEKGMLALARCKKLTGLRRLGLSILDVTPKAARALLDSPYLQNLEALVWFDEPEWSEELSTEMRTRFPSGCSGGDFNFSAVCNEDRVRRRMSQIGYGSSVSAAWY